jgi:hypothetical protein
VHGDVPGRVHALLDPPPRRRPGTASVLVTLVLTCALSAAAVQQCGERLFEHARSSHNLTAMSAQGGLGSW